ncbi:MAG: Gfo/Idh/MocA family oxidoreductase, partial [Treponema sp.]|nr:Gfo/Idh/MocA family oxidoreductase [Treponema sp.]
MDKQLIGGTETRRRYNKNEPVLNVAILGCGAIAEKRHAPVISRFKGAALYGLYGPHENRIRELACHYEAVKIFTELEPLLVDPQVKAVSICAPEKFHCELAVKSLEAGKHVLLEKPMAMTVAEAEHIIAARNHAGTLLMIAFSQRCYPQHILARRLLREGAIGQPLSFRTILSNSGVEYAVIQQNTSDFYDRNLANIGGVMLNVGCHRIDLIRFLFDSDFLRVLAYTQAMDKHFSSGKLI